MNRTISLAFTEPYWTVDGVSRTIEIYQRNIDTASLDVTSYTSSTVGAAIGFGMPVTESDTHQRRLPRRAHRASSSPSATATRSSALAPPAYCLFVADVGSPFNSYIVSGGWSRDTRDDILYPTRGRLQSFGVEVGLPFGDLPYYKANYLQQWFTPLPYLSDFVLMLRADLGYADGYSGKPLPFFKAFYAGGVGSVRGYETASIGPKDIYGNATGGKQKIVGNVELFYPILKGDKSVRRRASSSTSARSPASRIDNGSLSGNLEPGYQDFRYSVGVGPRRGTRRSARSSSATASRSTTSRSTRSSISSSRSGRCSRARTGDPTQQESPLNRSMRHLSRVAVAALPSDAGCRRSRSAAEYKIGFVNTERLFREAAPAKRAQQKLEKEFAARDAEIQKLAQAGARPAGALEKDGVTMSEAERRNKERDLANLTRDLQRAQREFREDLNLRRNEELASVQERANKVIQQIAEAEKFDLILQDPVVYASQRIDITDKVIKALADK